MARQTTRSAKSPARRAQTGSRDGRSASEKTGKYRFAQNVGGEETVAEREYRSYASHDGRDPAGEPDVLLDVPVVKVDSLHFELDDLDAHVALKAQVLDLVKLNVGVYVHLGKVKLDIKGVEAQALLKVRLDHVAAIVDRVLTTLDRNPELVRSLGHAVEDVGSGAGKALDETGEAVEDVGEGAEGAVQEVGTGAGQATGELGKGAGGAVGDLGEGAGQAVEQVGQGAGQAAGQLGQGAGQALGEVGQGAGQAVGNLDQAVGGLGQTAGQVGQGAGEAAGGLGQGVGEVAQGAGQAAGQAGQAAGGLGQAVGGLGQGGNGADDGGLAGASASDIAKLAAKAVAREFKSAAAEEAKELGLAATHKAKEVGERRKQRKAEELNATEAAMRVADELGVDLVQVEGSGPDGRITIRDVKQAKTEA